MTAPRRLARPRRTAPALAAVAAALLGACAVDVNGAPCAVPGTTTDCPGGQACGNDLRCSARALACAASRCTPGAGDACLDPAGAGTGTAVARWCDARDPVCGAWVEDRCADRGLVCGGRSGGARCECAASAARELTVLPDGGTAAALPYATGAASPPGCAFRTLGAALARARDLRRLDPASVVTVTAAGVPAGSTRTFSEASGEQFALTVQAGVVLRTDARSGGGTYELAQDHPGGSTSVVLYAGAALDGFTIRNVAAGAVQAVLHLCGGGVDPAIVSSVDVVAGAGGAPAATGISGVDDCPLVLADVRVRDAGVGIRWESAAQLTMSGGAVTGSAGDGIVAAGGRVLLEDVRVAGNAGRGVDASHAAVEIRRARIVRNGDTGLAVADAPELRVSGTTVWANGATTAWAGPSSGIARRAGGLALSGPPPAAGSLELWGNRVYGNGGDQVLIAGPPALSWNLDHQPVAPGCLDAQGTAPNLIGCYDPEPAGTTGASRGLVAIDVAASARNQWWAGDGTPSSGDAAAFPAGTVPVDGQTCLPSTPALSCGSEDPPP